MNEENIQKAIQEYMEARKWVEYLLAQMDIIISEFQKEFPDEDPDC